MSIKQLLLRLRKVLFQPSVDQLAFKRRGTNVVLTEGTFGNPEGISFGSHIYVGPEAYWWGGGGITVDDNVIFGPRVTIFTSNHRWEHAAALPYDEVSIMKPVHICTNVWVGANVLIVPGVTIHEGAVIASGSVVAKDVPAGALVGGNPAKVIRRRDLGEYERLKREGRLYMVLKSQCEIKPRFVTPEEAAQLPRSSTEDL